MIDRSHFEHFPQLESERLLYRKFTLEDASEILSIRSNTDVMRYMDSKSHGSIADSKKFISGNLDIYKKEEGIFWAIIEKSTGAFAGDFSFWRIDKKNSRGEIGYTLKPEFWGNGFMTEAMTTLISFGFNQLNLHSIEANINPVNEASRKLLLKMGFRKEAYFRENYYFNGKFLDSEIYSLLERNFMA